MKHTLSATAAFALLAFGLALPRAAAATTVVTVTPADVGGHWFTADTRPGGSATFQAGPATPPYGTDSLAFATTLGTSKAQFLTDLYAGTPLADIDGLGYHTYRDPSATGFAAGLASLNLRVDLDGNGSTDAYVVFEPYQDQGNAAVLTGVWQTWDAHRGGAARWWINNGAGGCGQNTPCAWSTIVAAFPSAVIREGVNFPGSLGVNQGSGNAGFLTHVDGLYVSVDGAHTTFNFERFRVPAVADDCKNGGWQVVSRPDGSSFRNQGDCIQFVNTGR